MRIANLDGRLSVLAEAGSVDVEGASGGRFGADPQAVYGRWAWPAPGDELVSYVQGIGELRHRFVTASGS